MCVCLCVNKIVGAKISHLFRFFICTRHHHAHTLYDATQTFEQYCVLFLDRFSSAYWQIYRTPKRNRIEFETASSRLRVCPHWRKKKKMTMGAKKFIASRFCSEPDRTRAAYTVHHNPQNKTRNSRTRNNSRS